MVESNLKYVIMFMDAAKSIFQDLMNSKDDDINNWADVALNYLGLATVLADSPVDVEKEYGITEDTSTTNLSEILFQHLNDLVKKK